MQSASHVLITVLLIFSLAAFGCAKEPDASKGPFTVTQLSDDGLPVVLDPEPSGFLEHDESLFTQGLLYSEGRLYESTGMRGHSKVLAIDPESAEVLKQVNLSDQHFGEGLAEIDGQLFQLTWEAGVCLLYDKTTLEPKGELFYGTQGWGLTVNPEGDLVLSDGSAVIRIVTAESLIPQKSLTVTDGKGEQISNLNELEWVKGEIWANVWTTDRIARIDPASGKIKSWIQLSKLVKETQTRQDGVLNGIAYDPKSDTLWLTGKYWKKIYRFDEASKIFGL